MANIFTGALQQEKEQWHRGGLGSAEGEVPEQLRAYLGRDGFFLMPITIGGSPRGLFYADRGKSGRALDEEVYAGFRHFCEQAIIGMSVLSKQRKA